MPRPMSSGAAKRIGARPPHTADQSCRASRRARPARSAAGRPDASHRAGSASCALPRSIASTYCVRSLVPMERKSASAASRSADDGGGRRFDHHAERGFGIERRSSRASSVSIARTALTSATEVTIGSMMPALPGRLHPQRSARNCVAQQDRAGAKPARTPRKPSAGFSSGGNVEIGNRLVAADIEGADDQRRGRQARRRWPDSAPPARLRTAARRSMKQEFACAAARSLPRPDATRRRRFGPPAPRLAKTSIRVPSAVRQSSRARRARRVGFVAPRFRCGRAASRSVAASASDAIALIRIEDDLRAVRDVEHALARATSAGMFMPPRGSRHAMSARRPPCRSRRCRARRAARSCDGKSSRATRIAPRGKSNGASPGAPASSSKHLPFEIEQILHALPQPCVVQTFERARIARAPLGARQSPRSCLRRWRGARSRPARDRRASAMCAARISRRWRSPLAADKFELGANGGQRAGDLGRFVRDTGAIFDERRYRADCRCATRSDRDAWRRGHAANACGIARSHCARRVCCRRRLAHVLRQALRPTRRQSDRQAYRRLCAHPRRSPRQ